MSYFRNLDKSLLPDLFKPVEPPPAPSRGLLRGAADLGAEAVSGVARGVKFTADAFGAENAVSRGAGYVDDLARGLLSAQAQGEDQQIAQIMAEAQDKGVWEQVVAAAKAFAVAPGRMAVNALGTSVPAIGAAMIPGVGQAGTAARLAALGGVGAAQGAGVVKGSIYEAVYEAHKQDGASEEEARAAAEQAQAYGGGNTDLIAGGAALGSAATATGAQPIIARALGKQAVDAAVKPGIARGVGRGILAETPLEAAQGGQEQLATNIALQREGADVPTWRGVAGSAALEGMAAAPIGGVAGGIEGAQANRAAQRKADADAALTALGAAATVDEAVDLATKATDIPLLPAPTINVGEDGTAQTAAQRQRAAEEEAAARLERAGLRESGAQGLGRNSESAARDLAAWMDQAKPYPIQRAQEMAQIAEQRGIRLEIVPHSSGQGFTLVPAAWLAGQPRSQVSKNPNEGELPAAQIEPLPTPDVLDWLEDIPAGDAAEVLPVGDAAEVLPTADVIEEPEPLPTGEATAIEPEQADTEILAGQIQPGDLLTGDSMPYGTRSGAYVRARRDGGTVVAVPGGWIVRPNRLDGNASPDQSRPNVAGGFEPEVSRDGVDGPARRQQRYSDLNAPSKRMVLGAVLRSIENDEILKRVVEAIPVDVVNVLVGGQGSAKSLGHYRAMFKNALAARPQQNAVSANVNVVADAIVSAVAGVAAELRSAPANAVAVSDEARAAVNAVETAVRGQERAATDFRAEQAAGLGRGDFAGRAGNRSAAAGTVDGRQVDTPTSIDEPGPSLGATSGGPPTVRKTSASDNAALTVKALSAQWADAVARGDMAEAKRLNDAIVEARKPPAAPEPEVPAEPATREQAIRAAVRALPSRPAGEWMPVTVKFNSTATPMLVKEKRPNANGGPSGMQVRAIRMGIRVDGGKREPLIYTFDLSADDKLTQRGTARPPTADEVAEWEAAGFTAPGKPAATPAPATAPTDTSPAPVEEPAPREQVAEAPAPQPEVDAAPAAEPVAEAPDPIRAELQTAMDAAGWTAEVDGPGNTIWTKRQKGERYTARLMDARGDRPMFMEVTVLADGGVDTGIAELTVKSAAQAARDANKAIADSEAESAPAQVSTWTPAPAPAPAAPTNPPPPPAQTRPERLIELRKRQSVLKQLLECLG